MCNLTKRRTGWKVLAYIDKNFYSTFTGQRIRTGKVPKPPVKCNRLTDNWNSSLDKYNLKHCGFYHESFVGKTSAFITLWEAINLYNDINNGIIFNDTKIVLTKITFDNVTYTGTYQDHKIIASDTIKSIKIIQTN
jgi:hypothetical protein